MVLIENWKTELRSWLFPVLRKLRHRPERRDTDTPLSKRVLTIRLPVEISDELEVEACKRGVTVAELCSRLICVTAKDGLVDAVLDDHLEQL
jgi:hypothetical protein